MLNRYKREPSVSFSRVQQQFTAHIRDPDNTAAPNDVSEVRMAVYRELLYNNIENFLASGFPVIRSIYADQHWHQMVRDFMIKHRCRSPYFLQIAEEFVDYLQHERTPQAEDPAGLTELAHYEWSELALTIADDETPAVEVDIDGDLLAAHPVLSPLAWLLVYQFPVHRMSKDCLPAVAAEVSTYLLIYRNADDDIQFMEVNAVTATLVSQLEQQPQASGREILRDIAQQLNARDIDSIIAAGFSSLQALQSRGIILGTAR